MSVEPDLSVDIGGLRMRNPVMTASGTFGYGEEYAGLIDLNRLGAVVVKGLSIRPVEGNPPPRTAETPAGLLNAIGLQNPGVEEFLARDLPFLRRYDVPVVANLWGRSIEDYEAVAERLDAAEGVAALEVNVSCPNIKEGSALFAADPVLLERVVRAVRVKTRKPMIVKLAPDLSRMALFARVAEAAGADALAVTNSIPGMAVDVERRRPKLGHRTGGLSGPAIRPIAVRLVWETARAVRLPVIGMGGIACADDALEFLLVGARAVAVGTATFLNPAAAIETVEGLRAYMVRHGFGTLGELTEAFRS